jgi:hypothetical protein
MNLQVLVTALMFAENDTVFSAKVLCILGGGHRGIANCDGEVFERAGLPREEEQLYLVEVKLEVVG